MYRILKIGMDVHSKTYTLCAMEPIIGADDRILANIQVDADYKNVLLFIEDLKVKLGSQDTYDIQCGYEAGCLGYSLYNQLTENGVNCVILAPSTMLTQQGKRIKTDKRDAHVIAQCLSYGTYHPVYVPTAEDDSVKEYIRMRKVHKDKIKEMKQRIGAFCMRKGLKYDGTSWSLKHLQWLRNLKLSSLNREILDEYMATFGELTAKVERFDARIEELAAQARYQEKVKRLGCLLGIQTHTALSLIVETGDFHRFAKGNIYAAYLGMAPGENSSGDKVRRTGISKAGNNHLRKLLIEASQGICKGRVGYKSKVLRARQAGNTAEVIAYADKGNVRLRKKYYKMIRGGKKRNVAVVAVARELACFVWGMMTDNISI